MKSFLAALALGVTCGSVAAQKAAENTPVPVEMEPLHKLELQNEAVTVLHLTLAPGQRTQYHTHTHDRIAIALSSTSITQQKINEKEGAATPTKPGDISALTLTELEYTHRVHNVGKAPYEVLDIELLFRPEKASTDIAGPVAAETPSARVYNWVLAPGASAPMHKHARPYVIVAVTSMNLAMASPEGQSATRDISAGDFRYVGGTLTHNLTNAGSTPGQVVEIELK